MGLADGGRSISDEKGSCKGCDNQAPGENQPAVETGFANLVGFSSKIDDPAFEKYIINANRWAGIFSAVLAFAAIAGFWIYGETSAEMDNPQALFIGLGIGGMFLLIASFQVMGRKSSTTWDGIVVDKKVKGRRRRQNMSGGQTQWVHYKTYSVFIRSENGKTFELLSEDDDTVYNYYRIGDRVRHHGGLQSYEKYDKSEDDVIFCNACASLNDIGEDKCFRCGCPLLK